MQKEILPLTSLRFITAFYVFLFHLERYWLLVPSGDFAHFLMKGSCGMSMFFILSGFVLSYRFHNGITNYKNYAFGRFARIYPAYFLAALVTLPWLFISVGPYDTDLILRYGFIILLNILMLQAWIPQIFPVWNIGSSWSICVEAFFYALFPFFINYIKNLSNKTLYLGLIGLYLTTSFPGISFILFDKDATSLVFYSFPIFRVSEFLIGVISGLLFARGYRFSWPNLCSLISASLLYIYLGQGPNWNFVAIAHHFVTIPLFALLLFSVASLSSGWLYRLLANRLLVYLGRISYSFYSFQTLILLFLLTKHNALISRVPLMANVYVLSCVSFVSLLTIAAVSYHLIENKFRSYLNKQFEGRFFLKDNRLAIAS